MEALLKNLICGLTCSQTLIDNTNTISMSFYCCCFVKFNVKTMNQQLHFTDMLMTFYRRL